jgi:hypothetical protein
METEQLIEEEISQSELQKALQEIDTLEARKNEIYAKYKLEMTMEYVAKIRQKKHEQFQSGDKRRLEELLINYFKVQYQSVSPRILDKHRPYSAFYSIITLLDMYIDIMPHYDIYPKTLPVLVNDFKREYAFFSQFYTSFVTRKHVGFSEFEYKLVIPNWKNPKTHKRIIDWFSDTEFHVMMMSSYQQMEETISLIIKDLNDIVSIGNLIAEAYRKQEEIRGTLRD